MQKFMNDILNLNDDEYLNEPLITINNKQPKYVIKPNCSIMLILNIIPMLLTTILSYFVGFLYVESAEKCDNNLVNKSFMRLTTWLITYGSVELFTILVGFVIFIMVIYKTKSILVFQLLPILYGVYIMWKMSWFVIGSVLLFEYDAKCINTMQLLWYGTFGIWVFDGVYIIIIVTYSVYTTIKSMII
jgi:hypothetical protein